MKEYVHGDKFVELCDYKIDTNDFNIDVERLKRNQLVFVKTDKILDFFSIVRDLPYQYIIITHNSDHNIIEGIYWQKPPNIILWYAQNCLVNKPDVIPIPIGIERPHVGSCGDQSMLDKYKNSTKDILCYCNFSPSTNYNERGFNRNKPFITNDFERISFEEHTKKLARSYFCISPPGNGHDCHRTWEALYLNTIPILKRSYMSEYFSTLMSMVLVDSYEEITEDFLLSKIKNFDNNNSYFSYWRETILESRKFLK
jgi:hypothetical protein